MIDKSFSKVLKLLNIACNAKGGSKLDRMPVNTVVKDRYYGKLKDLSLSYIYTSNMPVYLFNDKMVALSIYSSDNDRAIDETLSKLFDSDLDDKAKTIVFGIIAETTRLRLQLSVLDKHGDYWLMANDSYHHNNGVDVRYSERLTNDEIKDVKRMIDRL